MSAVRQSIKGLIFPLDSSSSANSKQPPAGQQHPWQAPNKPAWIGQQHNWLSESNNIPAYLICVWSAQLQERQVKRSFDVQQTESSLLKGYFARFQPALCHNRMGSICRAVVNVPSSYQRPHQISAQIAGSKAAA